MTPLACLRLQRHVASVDHLAAPSLASQSPSPSVVRHLEGHMASLAFWLLLLMASASASASPEVGHRARKASLVQQHLRRLKKKDGVVKLVDGRGDFEGNVEVLHDDRWGSVCDDEWDLREAHVVCAQLGFPGVERVTHSSRFGPARRKYWMDNVYCTGSEPGLATCRFDGWGESDCTPSEAAGVVCTPQEGDVVEVTTTPAPPPPRRHKHRIQDRHKGKLSVRVAGGRIPTEGRVEVLIGGVWSLVCGDGWSLLEANVVCREVGLGFASDAVQTSFFGGDARRLALAGVECRGNETRLAHCRHDAVDVARKVSCPGRGVENIAGVVCLKELADLEIDVAEMARTAYLQDSQLFFLQCAMEENCLAAQAYKAQRDAANWHLESRRLLRFTARILNVGTADFRPLVPKHLWEFHQCHMHYHSMEVFATFDVLDGAGTRVAEGHKASFCLEDNQCLPGVDAVYACANFGDQGISVNCSDIYKHTIDCQWVDISELSAGTYTFKVSINPEFKVGEQSFENNAAVCSMLYTESAVHIGNCSLQRP